MGARGQQYEKQGQRDKRQKEKTTNPDLKLTIPTHIIANFGHVGRKSHTH